MPMNQPVKRSLSTIVYLVLFLAPFWSLSKVDAASVACGTPGHPACAVTLYAGQESSNTLYKGIRGWMGFPSTTLFDPNKDIQAHWLGLHTASAPFYGVEWIQLGAVNGAGNGANASPRSSLRNFYAERSSWCHGYSAYSISPYQVGSYSRQIQIEYTGHTWDCGSGGQYTLHRSAAYTEFSTFQLETYTYYFSANAAAKAELDAAPGGYWDPIGTQPTNNAVCFGGLYSSNCSSSSSSQLQRRDGPSWFNWGSSSTYITVTAPASYNRTNVTSNYHFFVTSSY